MLAYAIWLLAMVHAIDAWTMRRETAGALILAGAITLQAMLGIATLLARVPIELALVHQMAAIVVFTIALVHAERLWHRSSALAPNETQAEARA
jgi:cytochrome c oxidase assembly protein subunit 15